MVRCKHELRAGNVCLSELDELAWKPFSASVGRKSSIDELKAVIAMNLAQANNKPPLIHPNSI